MDEFEQIYLQYFDGIFRFVNRRVADISDVEDIVSETFESLWKSYNRLNQVDETRVKNLIYKIASNKVNDFLRKKYRFKIVFLEEDFVGTTQNDNIDRRSSVYLDIVSMKVNKLRDRDREFYSLKYVENCTYAEIAQKMRITVANAKVINNRLVTKLKNLIQNNE